MNKILTLQTKDREGNLKETGRIEIKNALNGHADLYFYGDIVSDSWRIRSEEDKCPEDVAKILKDLNNYETIDIYINSGGGSVFAGIAIYNMLKRYKGKKITHIDGIAASIASVIALAGDEIRMPSYSQLMIHKPHLFLFLKTCNSDDFKRMAGALDACQKSILNIYMENAKPEITEEEMTELINNETWFTGDEAKDYFNIIIEDEDIEPVASISNFYNYYKNTPKNLLNKKINNQKQKTNNNEEKHLDNLKEQEKEELNKLKERLSYKNKCIDSFLFYNKNQEE